ncbi:MAG: PTS sugar transporter subunit IIA [Deltaproteobacteria bacterium]|nr:PTS sugar transporter subunit IIA [Deltaproteobacteria bacterium]
MNINIRDAAAALNVSEKTIYRWIHKGIVPVYKVNEQYRLNRAELLEWATKRNMAVSPDIFREPESEGIPMPSLVETLQTGGIFYRVEGDNKKAVLRSIIEHIWLPEEVDREFLLQVLLAREELGSTGIGDGIAIPHVRNPVVLHITRPFISLCFLEEPIDFSAIDGKHVHALFTIMSPTVRAHLHMLSRISFALKDKKLRAAVKNHSARKTILGEITRIENKLNNE